jgi:hypothetical protein
MLSTKILQTNGARFPVCCSRNTNCPANAGDHICTNGPSCPARQFIDGLQSMEMAKHVNALRAGDRAALARIEYFLDENFRMFR